MVAKNQTKDVFEQDIEKSPSRLKQLLITLSIVFFGIFAFVLLIIFWSPPEKEEHEILAPLVVVEQLKAKDIQMVIRAYGTVSPKVEVDIVPEVSGKVVSVNSELKPGGLIPAGDQILQIDERDYKFAVQQTNAVVADAQVKLEIEMAEAEVARREWEQLHPDTEPNSPLVLRESQVRKAKAALESAKAQLETAKLRLERTSLSLPFDALIISERADIGQYVRGGMSGGMTGGISLGSPLAVAYGIESVEIVVPLEDDELAWFDVFENSISVNGSRASVKRTPAKVKADFAGAEHTWKGYVTRTTGQVDNMSRMISVVVEVTNPFERSNGRPPLLPGIFAEILIEGKVLKNAMAVPRDAIHDSNKVWIVKDGSLHIEALDIVRADKDFAYAMARVDQNATIVTSSLDTVMEGMKVRTQLEQTAVARQLNQDPNNTEK
jgi:RND family efflux transporter MFP subunit